MFTESKNEGRLEFRGGMFGLIVPFIALFVGIILLSAQGKAMPMAFWVPALAGVLCAIILAKNPKECADTLVRGMASEMVAIMLMAWFLAGIVAELMKATGLIQGLIWLSLAINLKGATFPLITFVIGCLLSTATGTALGTVIALTPILYPVGVALGANPPVLLAAIVSAAYFGDNIAPVSDTTIASAYTQGVSVAKVVRSRLKYAFVAAGFAAIMFLILGKGTANATGDLSFVGELSPKGLIMLVVPALLIFLMYRGTHLIVALVSTGAIGIVVGLVSGLLPASSLLIVDMNSFSVGGILVDGIMSLIDIAVFAMFLMGLVHLLEKGGFFDMVIEKLSKYTETHRSAELMIALINVILCLLTVANSVAIVIEGPVAKKMLVEKHNISRAHSANMLDAVSCAAMCVIPYGFAPILAIMFAQGSGAPVNFSVNSVAMLSFYGWGLFAVMFFSIMTGWGRTFETPEEREADKI